MTFVILEEEEWQNSMNQSHFHQVVQLKNRLMLSPMTTELSFFNGVITKDEIEYYAQRSKGLGAVITGAANVQDIGKRLAR